MPATLQHNSNAEIGDVFHAVAAEEILRAIEGHKEGAHEDNKGESERNL
jgi:hypothetical protein